MKLKLKISYSVCIILLSVLSITRIYRNSLGYENEGSGGIWNIISLVFVGLAILAFFGVLKRRYKFPSSILCGLACGLLAQFHSLYFIEKINITTLYNFLMIGYFASVLIVFFVAGQEELSTVERVFALVMFTLVMVMSFVSVFWFKSGRLEYSMVSNAYYALCLLPFVLMLCKNKIIQTVCYIVVGVIVIFSEKRTGLIAFGFFVFIVIFGNALYQRKTLGLVKKIVVMGVAVFAFSLIYSKLEIAYDLGLMERMANLAEDEGSGRLDIYRQIWGAMEEANLFEWIFGHGHASSAGVILHHDTAHNDFLEILYNYGLAPTILLVMFYGALLVEAYKMIRTKYQKAHIFLGGVIISFILSMFSTYCVSFAYVSCGMAFLGFVLGQWKVYLSGRREIHEINHGNNASCD